MPHPDEGVGVAAPRRYGHGMDAVTIITGGAGGMGRATAEVIGRDQRVVLYDVRADRLETVAAELAALGIEAVAVHGDVTDRAAVDRLFETAGKVGRLSAVIHAAGVSPSMGDAEYVLRTNALGTVHVGEGFHVAAPEGAALVNVASMAGHLLPAELIPTASFPRALTDPAGFVDGMLAACEVAPEEARSGIAYALSKNFVTWYSTSQAERFTGRGQRVVSVSPGSIDTEMGRLEEKAGAGALVADAAVPRWGRPEEMADLLAFCASSRAGYLTGTDILNDGGVVASLRERARAAAAG